MTNQRVSTFFRILSLSLYIYTLLLFLHRHIAEIPPPPRTHTLILTAEGQCIWMAPFELHAHWGIQYPIVYEIPLDVNMCATVQCCSILYQNPTSYMTFTYGALVPPSLTWRHLRVINCSPLVLVLQAMWVGCQTFTLMSYFYLFYFLPEKSQQIVVNQGLLLLLCVVNTYIYMYILPSIYFSSIYNGHRYMHMHIDAYNICISISI